MYPSGQFVLSAEAVPLTFTTPFIFLPTSQVPTAKHNLFTIYPFPIIMSTFAYKAHLAARSPAGGQKKMSHHHGGPPPKHTEEPVSPTFHPPVLARAHAHQFIHSQGGESGTIAPRAAVDPPLSNNFAGQGAYRARIFDRYGFS